MKPTTLEDLTAAYADRDRLLARVEELEAENERLKALLNDLFNEHAEMNAVLLKQGRGVSVSEMTPAGEARAAIAGREDSKS